MYILIGFHSVYVAVTTWVSQVLRNLLQEHSVENIVCTWGDGLHSLAIGIQGQDIVSSIPESIKVDWKTAS